MRKKLLQIKIENQISINNETPKKIIEYINDIHPINQRHKTPLNNI